MAFHRYLGVEVRIARIFNTFGPRMRHDDGRVIPTFIKQALFQEPLTIFGDGSQTRSFCFFSDLVGGLITLMNNEKSIGPFNLGNPHELSMLELAQEINTVLENSAGIVHKPLPLNDPTRRRPDLTKTEGTLGWSPRSVVCRMGFGRRLSTLDGNCSESSKIDFRCCKECRF